MARKLYEIDNDMHELLTQMAEGADTLTPEEVTELLVKFEESRGDRKEKFDNTLGFMESEKAFQEGLDAQIKRMTALKASSVSKCNSLLSYLTLSLENAGERELKTNLHTLKFVKNPPAFPFTPEKIKELEDKFGLSKLKDETKAASSLFKDEKTDLINKVKAGEEIDGVTKTQGERLKIS